MSSNLPPGVTEGMIPGNRPEDWAWERLHEAINRDAAERKMSDIDAYAAWSMGLAALDKARQLGAKFIHDPE